MDRRDGDAEPGGGGALVALGEGLPAPVVAEQRQTFIMHGDPQVPRQEGVATRGLGALVVDLVAEPQGGLASLVGSGVEVRRGTGPGRARLPACLGQCPVEEQFNLSIETAKLLRRPSGESVVDGGVDPQQEGFFPTHQTLRVQGAGVDHGLSSPLGTEHHEEVTDHRRPALVVEAEEVLG